MIAASEKDKAKVDDFYPEVGSGSLITGFLTLATDKVQGYGTNG